MKALHFCLFSKRAFLWACQSCRFARPLSCFSYFCSSWSRKTEQAEVTSEPCRAINSNIFSRDVKLFVRDKNYSRKWAKKLVKKGLLIQKFLFLWNCINLLIVKQQKFRIWPLFKQLFDIIRFDKFYSNKQFNIPNFFNFNRFY